VYTEADMHAIVNTNIKVMWNGDAQNPRWANSNTDLHRELGKPEAYEIGGKRAGIVWNALAQLDPTERSLVAQWVAGLKHNSGRNDTIIPYFNNVIAKTPPSYARQDAAGDVQIPSAYTQFPMGDVRTITFATVLPASFDAGDKAVITCKLMEDGDLDVSLYSSDGQTKVASLMHAHQHGGGDGREGIVVLPFTAAGSVASPGDYRVRWTIAGDGYREYPITIRAGTK
jgi:hypothetical protein